MDKLLAMIEPHWRALQAPAQALAACRRGATAVEYGLIAALIVLGLVTVLEGFRDSLIGLPMNAITTAIAAALS